MDIGRAIKRRAKAAVPPLLFLSLVAYFGWNATRGDRGLQAYAMREQQLAQVKAELARAQAEQSSWERKVNGLRTSHIDPDTLDERARAMLNLSDPSDVVVPYPQSKKLF
ncbi:MAG TPA: septum formation initiator family protein [Acetobacteraceae bacterium]|nr:septum formation initiator family protein [Acetobacteraceae bacterium]